MRRDTIFANLNENQAEAVSHVEGPMLTLAGPGSGKTRVVTHRVANLMGEGISPHSILALTFTNKAADEMKKRLRTLAGDAPVWMGTFHGYCARFLRRHAELIGLPINFSIYDPSDAKLAMKEAVERSKVSLTHLNADQIARAISDLKNKLVTPEMLQNDHLDHHTKVLSQIYPAYQQTLLQYGAVDFDDLLMHTAVILRTHPEIRSSLDRAHRYILVDEYQDTNMAQYVIVRALSQDYPNLNVTGDPDQSVYGWRGANIGNIMSFERDYPNVKVVRLEQNYRSTPQILSAADFLIQHNSRRKAKTLLPTRDNGAPIRFCIYPQDRDEANHIADQIQRAILEEGRSPKDFAVLYRTNAQSRLLEQALMSRRIGYQLIGGFRFYQRQEIKDLLAYLTLLHNPTDDVAFARVINTPIRGLGAKALEKVQNFARTRGLAMLPALRLALTSDLLSKKAAGGAKQFLALYDDLASMIVGSVVDLLNHLIKATDYVNYLQQRKTDAPDNSVQSNVNELLADAATIDDQFPNGDGLEPFLEQVSLVSDTDSWESTDERVTLMTLHSCKGLEFPAVFIIAVENDILPHVRSKQDPDQMEEERRLLFVGITRAKDLLQLSIAQHRGFGRSQMSVPSPFLMELPRREMVTQDFTDAYRYEDDSYDPDVDFASTRSSLSKTLRSRTTPLDDDDAFSSEADLDDVCQLPPDEIAAKLREMAQQRKATHSKLVLRRGSEIAPPSNSPWQAGTRVVHPGLGPGLILSLSGIGNRQVARIEFDASRETKSIVVAAANLRLEEEEISEDLLD